MRGSRWQYITLHPTSGIIPAHAGLTFMHRPEYHMIRDHPRACGAHLATSRYAKQFEGSSPRMRGSQARVHRDRSLIGIIPAHAGLTSCQSHKYSSSRDHPRACGAHTATAIMRLDKSGSSPRMRGSLDVERQARIPHGIIPAHAGLTQWNSQICRLERDHPRACGAHRCFQCYLCLIQGSSPRMRGSH